MDVIVKKSRICGELTAPESKSVAHRVMIATALAGGDIPCANGGKDVAATERCLRALMGEAECYDEQNVTILNAGESGSTLRFLLPVAGALGIKCVFDGEGRLKERPLDGLIKTLCEHGIEIEKLTQAQLPLRADGRLSCGTYSIEGGVSSQYVTGLLFALPLLDGDSRIVISGEIVSANYIDITLGVLADFGIKIQKTDDGFFVEGNQKYRLPESMGNAAGQNNYRIESDWSSAGFLIGLGLLSGETRIGGLRQDSLQGDRVVVELLRRAGGDIMWQNDVLVSKKSQLTAIDFDAENCPDAVPIMAALLSFADGVSHISHIERLRYKESDRLNAVQAMLASFGIKTQYSDGVLSVYGGVHTAGDVDSFNDHRMAMSAIVCALATDGESRVRGVECINKSYPDFLKHALSLGADIRTVK